MKRTFILSLFVAATLSGQTYELVWSDEFDGNKLDTSKWEVMLGDGQAYGLPSGWGNNELQYYRRENIEVKDGLLIITAKKEEYGGKGYTSGRIRTKGKGDWLYGRFEMRAKMPIGKGIWPAFWMLPSDKTYGGWAASGEIDIMEYLGHEPNVVRGTLHYGGTWPNNVFKGSSYTLPQGTFADDFHVFALEWERTRISWYVDGRRFRRTSEWYSTNGSYPAPFDVPFHILTNMAVGGNWPGAPNASTLFPQQLVIDYVRVYQVPSRIERTAAQKPADVQVYPNPFNLQTVVEYHIDRPQHVAAKIYDIDGRLVETLSCGLQKEGKHEIVWHSSNQTSGIYLLHLCTEEYSVARRLTIIK